MYVRKKYDQNIGTLNNFVQLFNLTFSLYFEILPERLIFPGHGTC